METSAILLAVILFLGATAICVLLFEWLGFGSVLGFIVAGILIDALFLWWWDQALPDWRPRLGPRAQVSR